MAGGRQGKVKQGGSGRGQEQGDCMQGQVGQGRARAEAPDVQGQHRAGQPRQRQARARELFQMDRACSG